MLVPAKTETRRIIITADTKANRALKETADRLAGINKNTKSLASSFGFLKGAFIGYFSIQGLRQLAAFSDEMQNLGNRLKIVSQEGEDTALVMRNIVDLANETNLSVADVGTAYTRLASSLKAASANTAELTSLTKVLINSFRVSGASVTETTNTLIQLSQAFASGELRGQELRSVLEQNATLAQLLRERFGQGIFKAAEKGLISVVEVLKVLRDNQERINEQAKLLAPTFEQTLTKALNSLRIGLYNLNKDFDLSNKFAVGVSMATEAVTTLIRVLFDLGKAVAQLLGNEGLIALGAGLVGVLTVFNPILGTITAVGVAIYAFNDSLGEFVDKVRAWGASILEFFLNIKKTRIETLLPNKNYFSEAIAENLKSAAELKKTIDELRTPKYAPTEAEKKERIDERKALDDLIKKYEQLAKTGGALKKPKEILAELNAEFLRGGTTLKEYGDNLIDFRIEKLNREFRDGKVDVFQWREQLAEIQKLDLNRALNEGTQSLSEYSQAVDNLEIQKLNDQLVSGKINLVEYNQELIKIGEQFRPGSALVAGTASYLESIGTVSSNIADAIKNAFSNLEDSFLDFIKTGKFEFNKFAQAVLDDLTRIIIRASIIRPLAEGILGAGLGSSGSTTLPASNADYSATAANGYAFDKGIKKFARGGIVNSPTLFGYGNNKTGLMGEAGPEAVLPLQRGTGGKLGVQASVTPVTVNVINQSGNDVQQTETTGPNGEKTIDIIITSAVRDGILSGKYDKAFRTSYGLGRKGS